MRDARTYTDHTFHEAMIDEAQPFHEARMDMSIASAMLSCVEGALSAGGSRVEARLGVAQTDLASGKEGRRGSHLS